MKKEYNKINLISKSTWNSNRILKYKNSLSKLNNNQRKFNFPIQNLVGSKRHYLYKENLLKIGLENNLLLSNICNIMSRQKVHSKNVIENRFQLLSFKLRRSIHDKSELDKRLSMDNKFLVNKIKNSNTFYKTGENSEKNNLKNNNENYSNFSSVNKCLLPVQNSFYTSSNSLYLGDLSTSNEKKRQTHLKTKSLSSFVQKNKNIPILLMRKTMYFSNEEFLVEIHLQNMFFK